MPIGILISVCLCVCYGYTIANARWIPTILFFFINTRRTWRYFFKLSFLVKLDGLFVVVVYILNYTPHIITCKSRKTWVTYSRMQVNRYIVATCATIFTCITRRVLITIFVVSIIVITFQVLNRPRQINGPNSRDVRSSGAI